MLAANVIHPGAPQAVLYRYRAMSLRNQVNLRMDFDHRKLKMAKVVLLTKKMFKKDAILRFC